MTVDQLSFPRAWATISKMFYRFSKFHAMILNTNKCKNMNNIYFLRFFLQFVLVFSLYFIKIGPFPPKNASKKNCLFYPPSLLGNQALTCCHGFKSFFSGIFFRILGHFQCLMIGFFCSCHFEVSNFISRAQLAL